METMNGTPHPAAALRTRAEAEARFNATDAAHDIAAMAPDELRAMMHELQVHQIELEMQNDELRRAQAELDEMRARYFELYNFAPVGYVTVSDAGVIIEANATFASLMGVSRTKLLNHPITKFIHTDDQDIFYLFRHRLIDTNEPQILEMRMVTRTDRTVWMRLDSTTGIVGAGDRVYHIVMTDITQRKRDEDPLREIEERFRLIYENSRDAILFTNPDGTVYSANPAACRILGRSEEEICSIGRNGIIDLTDPNLGPAFEKRRTNGFFSGELSYVKADGTTFPVETSSTTFLDRDGNARTCMSFHDISKRKAADREIELSRDQLRELASHLVQVREEERTTIAREIHDELGQNLTALKMNISGIAKKLKNVPEVHEQLLDICGAVDVSIRSVRHIATQLRPGVLDELGLGAAMEWHAHAFMKESGIECSIDIDPAAVALPQQIATTMFRIFQEAFTNVARHSGATSVTTKLALRNHALYLEVADNGCGIPACKESDPRSVGLLGMKERALSLGGEVLISGIPDSGTTITAKIPLETL